MNKGNISGRRYTTTFKIRPSITLELAKTNQITCEVHGSSSSRYELIWKINGKRVTENKNVFTIDTTSRNSRVVSIFTIKSPISFELNTVVTCWFGRVPRAVVINSDFSKAGQNSYNFYFKKDSDLTGEFCLNYQGAVESFNFNGCIFEAAEIQQLPTPPNDCVGKVLLLKVNDFTYSSKNYQLILVNLNDSSTITKSQRETEFKFKNLIPNNVYDVEVRLWPDFWKNKVVLKKRFNTKATVPGKVEVTDAAIREEICEIEYNILGNIKDDEIEWVYLDILSKEITKENDLNTVEKFEYKTNKELLKFPTNSSRFRYLFSISVQSCNGLSGNKSELIPCLGKIIETNRETALSFVYYFLFLIVIAFVIVIRFFTKRRRAAKRKKRKAKTDIFKKDKEKMGNKSDMKLEEVNERKRKKKREVHQLKDKGIKKDKGSKKNKEQKDKKRRRHKYEHPYKIEQQNSSNNDNLNTNNEKSSTEKISPQ